MYDISINPFWTYVVAQRGSVFKEIKKAIPRREPKGHYDLVSDYPRRMGKYIRPGLLLLTCEILGGDIKKVMKVAAAQQLSEDWILIHDDIEDGSVLRRGLPALPEMKESSLGLAMNAGDALHMIMWKTLLDSRKELGTETALRLFEEFHDILLRTAEGQYMEMRWTLDNAFVGEKEYYKLVDRKTGAYTIAGPMKLGAICAKARPNVLRDLERLSVPLGRAFQIHDDWLDIYSKDLDKDLFGDLIEAKRTLLIHRVYDKASKADKARLKEIMGLPREERARDGDCVHVFLEMFERYGCKEHVRNIALENAQRSMKIIKGFSWIDRKGKRRLLDVVDLVIKREK